MHKGKPCESKAAGRESGEPAAEMQTPAREHQGGASELRGRRAWNLMSPAKKGPAPRHHRSFARRLRRNPAAGSEALQARPRNSEGRHHHTHTPQNSSLQSSGSGLPVRIRKRAPLTCHGPGGCRAKRDFSKGQSPAASPHSGSRCPQLGQRACQLQARGHDKAVHTKIIN